MRSLGLTITATALALGLATGLSGCGKPKSTEAAGAPAAPVAPLTDADKKAIQASMPAPYNTADLANGEAKFAMCRACHSLAPDGPNMTGPHLYGVIGRKAGSLPDFNYSDGVKAAGFTWDYAHLDTWITDPRAMIAGAKMTFAGLKDPKDRVDVIAYLKVNGSPKP